MVFTSSEFTLDSADSVFIHPYIAPLCTPDLYFLDFIRIEQKCLRFKRTCQKCYLNFSLIENFESDMTLAKAYHLTRVNAQRVVDEQEGPCALE